MPLPFVCVIVTAACIQKRSIISMSCFTKADLEGRSIPNLSFVLDDRQASSFFQILQRGFMLYALVGCTVESFLTDQIGLSRAYVRERIQSVFLDGKPVDDLNSAMIRDGSHLSLSAAMPGLVGATMRTGGIYSGFRSTITHHERDIPIVREKGCLHLKFFNLLMKELGSDMLKKGIYVQSSHLVDILSTESPEFWNGCKKITLNGYPMSRDSFQEGERLTRFTLVLLSVITPGDMAGLPSS